MVVQISMAEAVDEVAEGVGDILVLEQVRGMGRE